MGPQSGRRAAGQSRRSSQVEVHVEPGMRREPLVHCRVLVGAVVVADQVHVEVVGDLVIDLGQELLEFGRAVTGGAGWRSPCRLRC